VTRATGAIAAAAALPAMGRSAESAKPLRIALIGCGGRGNHHLRTIAGLRTAGEAVEIAGACDIYRPRAENTAKAHGVKWTMKHTEILSDPSIDAVCIATTDHTHGPLAIDAIRAGKDVYCEKPLTHWRQFEVAKLLWQEVKRTGRVLQLGTQGLSDRAWHQAADIIKAGDIGQPIHAECGYFRVGDWGERGMPIDDPQAKPGADLNWEAFLGDSPKREFDVSRFFRWRMYEDYAGGPVTDLFPHSLAPVVHMLGVGMPALVAATGGKYRYQEREVPDTFNMLIDYPQGITVAVLGTQANDFSTTALRGAGGRSPVIRGWEATLTIEGNDLVVRPIQGIAKPEKRVPISRGESEPEHWKDFFACIRSRAVPEASIDLGFRVQTATQMGMLSLRERKTILFDEKAMQIRL